VFPQRNDLVGYQCACHHVLLTWLKYVLGFLAE
jgi:hypothetical protein